jgi:DNA mismatch repair protein MutS2
MNEDIERILEFDRIREVLAGYCRSELGKSLLDRSTPVTDLNQIREMLHVCDEVKEINHFSGGLPLNGLKDIRQLIKKAEVTGSILTPEELLDIAATVQVAGKLVEFKEEHNKQYPMMSEIIGNISPFPEIENAIARCIDPEGNILDTASSALAKIRRQLLNARNKLLNLLESILQSPKYQTAIQENVITLRNDRYVIPVKQSHKGDFKGLIQGRSASGVTVFIEPSGAVELNNQLRDLSEQESIEIRRILRELTDEIRQEFPALKPTVDILGEIDLINAKALLSIRLKTNKPEISDDGYTQLIQARHPLLQMRINDTSQPLTEVVPIDFHIGDDFKILVITGPNTGGKTVALKTVGLLTLMTQFGLHIPADEGSQITVFKDIFADIGDEQSIEQNLSTFSSHMTRIIRILESADEFSLVLLDELGAGTEPSEGAALGMAILDFLHSRNVTVVATTHHDSLKAHAHSQDGMENASVAFDLKTLSPTYELRIGTPGSSNALKIADRLGLPKEIGEIAKNYLGSEAVEVADLIANVENLQRELVEQKRLTEERSMAASKAQQEHEVLLKELKIRKREMEQEALREASNIVQNARKLAEKTITDLRKQKASPESVQMARQELTKAKKEISNTAREIQPVVEGRKPDPDELKTGEQVYVVSLQNRGTLISPPDEKDMVQVRIGKAKFNVPAYDIRFISDNNRVNLTTDKKVKDTSTPNKKINIRQFKKSNVSPILDLRGNRAEEAFDKVDKYLDDAALTGLESVSIIHGKGTGVLREVVTDLLSEHPHVASFRFGDQNEGGLGVTVVELKD